MNVLQPKRMVRFLSLIGIMFVHTLFPSTTLLRLWSMLFQENKGLIFIRDETDQTEKIDESITCLEDFFRLAFSKGTPALSRITFLTEKGIAGVKITRCLWVDILKEFDDPKISYAVACHHDLHAARYINKNFRLTRKKTLMQGNGFCDFCWHDISIDKEMKHLSDDFWQELDDLAKNRSRL